MSAQRAEPRAMVDRRPIGFKTPGLPWWAAVVIAATVTALGVAFDAGVGHKELTNIFAVLYVLGCVAAVSAVQQSGVFTAVVQPPLILFCAVPGAYWLLHDGSFTDIKDLLINCGYPLIERFPLMLFTSVGVLLIGTARWYFSGAPRVRAAEADAEATNGLKRITSAAENLITKLSAVFNHRRPAHTTRASASNRRRTADRARRSTTRSRDSAAARRSTATRSRYVGPPIDDIAGRREQPPRRRAGRSAAGGGGKDPRRSVESPEVTRRYRPAPRAGSGTNTTHHPISRVRYRRDLGGEPDGQSASRSRRLRAEDTESWRRDS